MTRVSFSRNLCHIKERKLRSQDHSLPRLAASREGRNQPESLRPVIAPSRPPRQSTTAPQQVPVDHSSAFILRSKRPPSTDDDLLPKAEEDGKNVPFTGNALQWYLRRVDKSFDDRGQKPSAAANAYYKASQTQAGQKAVKGIGSVAGTAVKLSGQAVKAAAPVGKWALLKGLAAAGQLIAPNSNKRRKADDQ